MKKLLVIAMMVMGMSMYFTSCGNSGKGVQSANDTVSTDSVAADTVANDTVVADSVAADTVVAKK